MAASALSLISLVIPPVAVLTALAAVDLVDAPTRRRNGSRTLTARSPPSFLRWASRGRSRSPNWELAGDWSHVVNEIATEFLLLFAAIASAQQIRAVRIVLEWKGYVDDVSTLVHAADER